MFLHLVTLAKSCDDLPWWLPLASNTLWVFSPSPFPLCFGSDGSVQLDCLAGIQDKITVCATDDSYQKAKESMAQVEEETRSRGAIVIKPGGRYVGETTGRTCSESPPSQGPACRMESLGTRLLLAGRVCFRICVDTCGVWGSICSVPHFRQEGSNPQTGACPDRHCTAEAVVPACDHLQQRAQKEHDSTQAAPGAPPPLAGPQAVQEARADPEVAERRPPAVRQGLFEQPSATGATRLLTQYSLRERPRSGHFLPDEITTQRYLLSSLRWQT